MCIKTYEGLIGNQGYSFFPTVAPTFSEVCRAPLAVSAAPSAVHKM